MSNVNVKLNKNGLRELMKSEPIMQMMRDEASRIIDENSGGGKYALKQRVWHGKYINTIIVESADIRTANSITLAQKFGVSRGRDRK